MDSISRVQRLSFVDFKSRLNRVYLGPYKCGMLSPGFILSRDIVGAVTEH